MVFGAKIINVIANTTRKCKIVAYFRKYTYDTQKNNPPRHKKLLLGKKYYPPTQVGRDKETTEKINAGIFYADRKVAVYLRIAKKLLQ